MGGTGHIFMLVLSRSFPEPEPPAYPCCSGPVGIQKASAHLPAAKGAVPASSLASLQHRPRWALPAELLGSPTHTWLSGLGLVWAMAGPRPSTGPCAHPQGCPCRTST